MSTSRQKFDREFKLRVIDLSYERESIVDLAGELGIRPELIYRWRSEFKANPSGSFPGEGNESSDSESSRVRQLEKQLKVRDQELEILKKAIGIFSKRDGSSINL